LAQEATKFWANIMDDELNFDVRDQKIKALEAVTLD
jgi:hypothetical protein